MAETDELKESIAELCKQSVANETEIGNLREGLREIAEWGGDDEAAPLVMIAHTTLETACPRS